MPTLPLIAEHCQLSPDEVGWLEDLVEAWHLLADLSFSDLILWVPDSDDNIFWAVHQVRPATGPTALEEDVVGECIAYDPESLVVEAYLSELICETSNNKLRAGIPVDVHAIPVLKNGRCIAVVERHTNRMGIRAPGALEDAYLEAATCLAEMVWKAEFPPQAVDPDPAASPRVGDGMIRVSQTGLVTFASPNAVTAFRRMGWVGDLEGENFMGLSRQLLNMIDPADSVFGPTSSFGKRAQVVDISGEHVALRARVQPLRKSGVDVGHIVLCRDTTELRHRERQLVTKDATIREIHHRVKNNLQTVAALLRMQARRISAPEAKAALSEAMGRVAAIAVVHEILSQAFDDAVEFDQVCDRILAMVGAVASTQANVQARREGSFGLVPGGVATNLALVLTELCQNAVEHGLRSCAGLVLVHPHRYEQGGFSYLKLSVSDNGQGLPEGFNLEEHHSLGLSIVTTLVADLAGCFELLANPSNTGTQAVVTIKLSNPDR